MSGWMLFAAQAAAISSAITPTQIQTLPPAELGRRLLGPTRLPINKAFLAGSALEPPPAPGAPVATQIWLYEQAHESSEDGFCERVRYQVRLQPVRPNNDGTFPPAKADLVTPTTLYRWKTTDESGPVCGTSESGFLSVSDSDAQGIFAIIRVLAKAQTDLRQNKPLGFVGRIDTLKGLPALASTHSTEPVTDWKVALDNFPISEITRYRRGSSDDAVRMNFMAKGWNVDITIAFSGGITSLVFTAPTISPP